MSSGPAHLPAAEATGFRSINLADAPALTFPSCFQFSFHPIEGRILLFHPRPEFHLRANLHGVPVAHRQFARDGHNATGKKTVGHYAIQQRSDHSSMHEPGVTLQGGMAHEPRTHPAAVISADLQPQAVGVCAAADQAERMCLRLGRFELNFAVVHYCRIGISSRGAILAGIGTCSGDMPWRERWEGYPNHSAKVELVRLRTSG